MPFGGSMRQQYQARGFRQWGGMIHKALIILTLGAQFAFAPLRTPSESVRSTAVEELPDTANKIFWLTPSGDQSQGEKIPTRQNANLVTASR